MPTLTFTNILFSFSIPITLHKSYHSSSTTIVCENIITAFEDMTQYFKDTCDL